MNKKEFLETFDYALKCRCGTKQIEGKIGPIADRNCCDWTGVYAIFKDDELLYVGSGYTPDTHTVKDRLSQYVTKSDSGNSLWSKVVERGWAVDEERAIDVIKNFDFIAFEHTDLENYLIQNTQCDWNIKGKKR